MFTSNCCSMCEAGESWHEYCMSIFDPDLDTLQHTHGHLETYTTGDRTENWTGRNRDTVSTDQR